MRARVEIQNIEDMRRREGIEDVELREAIRGLRVAQLSRSPSWPANRGRRGKRSRSALPASGATRFAAS